MAYGTPDRVEDVEAYYTHIRRGRKPTPEQLATLLARYERVGGITPLRAITFAQAEAIGQALAAKGVDAAIYVGMKHWHPYVAEAVRAMAADGIERAVGFVLAPHYSRMSVGQYIDYAEAERTASAPGMAIRYVERWGMNEALLAVLANRVREALGDWDPARTGVIFTAHSLPERIRTWDDPYEREVAATAEAVARRLALPHWTVAWQSAGATAEPWIGPDLIADLRETAEAGTFDQALVCPTGFTADHLEILYDLDIEASQAAADLGLGFRRTRSLNADAGLVEAACSEVIAALQEA
jgi:ferrochelatase